MGNTFTVFIDTSYTLDDRRSIGQEIIRYIVDRTQDGLGIGRKPLGKYSENYKKSNEFKIAGKDGETKVNLTLSGEMLNTLEIIDISVPGRIEIGYEDGFESDKAQWLFEKGYDFLGLSDSELDRILSNFEPPSVSLNEIIRDLVSVEED